MGIVNTLGSNITNADATPIVLTDSKIMGGVPHQQSDTIEIAAADSDTSTYRLARVHSSEYLTGVWSRNDAITGGTSFDLGFYDIAANGGAVIDADALASAVDHSTAHTAAVDVLFEAQDIANCRKAVWEMAGLAADPHKMMDIVWTANTVGSGAGTLSLRVDTLRGY